ncbi:MAG: hypothetical protein MJD61_18255, partial [Proteobacteria bacterium]|nr:hypothetical protein [Pseudomonadota bacterium]
FGGLALASEDGCSWSFARGGVSDMEIIDVTVDPAQRAHGLALATKQQPDRSFLHRLWHTSDNGTLWQELGPALPAQLDVLPTAFDAAPGDRTRVYVSALDRSGSKFQGVLLRSNDRAATWSVLPVPHTGLFGLPYLSAVAPADPNTVYVRVYGQGHDRLLVSSNGGHDWKNVLDGRAVMAGFALSPDGSELAIGFGLPPRPRNIDCDRLGIWRASTSDLVFRKVFDGVVQCLTWTRRGLYACLSERAHGFQLGRSEDGGKSFKPLMKLRSVKGLACPSPSRLATACAEPWQWLCPRIGTSCIGPDAAVPATVPIDVLGGCRSDASVPQAPVDAGATDAGLVGPQDAATNPDGKTPVLPSDA